MLLKLFDKIFKSIKMLEILNVCEGYFGGEI